MLRIRLRRVGKKGNPSYRIVVAESTSPRDGRYLEWIGNYDPMANPPAVSLKEDRATQWLSQGAQPSDAVARILDKAGILERTPISRKTTPAATEENRESSGPGSGPVVTTTVTATAPAAAEVTPSSEATEATLEDASEEASGQASDEAAEE